MLLKIKKKFKFYWKKLPHNSFTKKILWNYYRVLMRPSQKINMRTLADIILHNRAVDKKNKKYFLKDTKRSTSDFQEDESFLMFALVVILVIFIFWLILFIFLGVWFVL